MKKALMDYWWNSGGYVFSDEYQAVLDWAAANGATPPSSLADKIKEDNWIIAEKAAGRWDTTDQAAFLGTFGDEAFSRINIKSPGTRNISVVGSPTFVSGWGWLCSTGNYLDTNFAPATHGVNFTQDVNGFLLWSGTERAASSGKAHMGAGGSAFSNAISLQPRGATNQLTERNNHATSQTTNSQRYTSGLFHTRRTTSTLYETYQNGNSRSSNTRATSGMTTQTIHLGGYNNNGTGSSEDNIYVGFWQIGDGWAGQETSIWSNFSTMRSQTIGAVSFPTWTTFNDSVSNYITAINSLEATFTNKFGAVQPILAQKKLTGSAVTGYQGSISAPDSTGEVKIFGLPSSATQFLKIDPITDTYAVFGDVMSAATQKTIAGVYINGFIYCAPFGSSATAVFKINTSTGAITYFDHTGVVANIGSGAYTGAGKWDGANIGSNGLIYMMPFDASEVMVIDPSDDSIYFIDTTGVVSYGAGDLTDAAKSDGGIAYGDFIYSVPSTVTYFIKVDVTTDTVTTFGSIAVGTTKYAYPAIARNSKIYYFPYGAANIMVLDPSDDSVTTFGTFTASGAWKCGAAVILPDGTLYGTPGTDLFGIRVDPDDNSNLEVGRLPAGTSTGAIGASLAVNGAVYSIPWLNSEVIKTYFPSMDITLSDDFVLSRYVNKSF